jgi:hypothetical protein
MGIELSEKPYNKVKSDNEDPQSHEKLRQMAEGLKRPRESLEYLEMYHKSALKVEEAAKKLKKASVGFGIISAMICVISAFSLFGEYFKQAPQKGRL